MKLDWNIYPSTLAADSLKGAVSEMDLLLFLQNRNCCPCEVCWLSDCRHKAAFSFISAFSHCKIYYSKIIKQFIKKMKKVYKYLYL